MPGAAAATAAAPAPATSAAAVHRSAAGTSLAGEPADASPTADPAAEPLVWYVSYGSNMARDRLACYLRGGRPSGALITYEGARDPSPPRAEMGVELPGRLYFAGESRVWGGGMAFYDHDVPGPTPAKAYLVTAGQFADIAAQEMHRVPDPQDPIEEVVVGMEEGARHAAGPGRYETLIDVGHRDGLPMLTFTAPDGLGAIEHTAPTSGYLAMLRAGLREAHGWDDGAIAAHLADRIAA
ncbi:histone deacetylase [Brevibacterium rongguiense]|nr:histone deacetylase [Brevibacterium rongguiense]